MSRLSLECAASTTGSQTRMQSVCASAPMPDSEHPSDTRDWEMEGDDEDEEEEEEEEGTDTVPSPTGLRYNISRLSPRARQMVKGLFNQARVKEPPQISLELCGIREEDPEGNGFFYAFQMHEVVPCSVRIGSRRSGRFSTPRCECPDARYQGARPCKHLVWLFDRISKQALFDHDPDSELTLTEFGFPEELGDPFDQISQIGLDILADDLRCDASEPDSDVIAPNPARVREAREMVAAVAGIQPGELDEYRPDLEVSYGRDTLIRRGDLGATLFSLILASHSLAEWVRSELNPSDPAVDPFRSIQHRVIHIIRQLDACSSTGGPPEEVAEKGWWRRADGPRNADWACVQIQRSVKKIEKLVSRGPSPLTESARSSAARSLVVILKAVVSHRDLYGPLIGDRDTGFVHSALDMLADQSQFIDALEEIMDRVGVRGAPPSYVANMRCLIERMRSHCTTEQRVDEASDPRRVGRSETPPLLPPDQQPPPPGISGNASVQFLTPVRPSSAIRGRGRGGGGSSSSSSQIGGGGRGRGGKGGRGAKRTVSPSSPPVDSPEIAAKRARGS
ncbi:uncharacterized protein P884DRAFT_208334 [Thermothelomyces heterothallicus CBS 202.75]|uniref:uncharacterized protein n=1 Tax=Thermothelomyces heterothallicus CBS 202.75 TaxID=1149848 RepID=UPI003743479A